MTADNIFSGLKVVDLASFLAGPGAATVLSDYGADVIKVEPPGIGDPHRFTYNLTYAHDQPPERQSRSAEAVGG